MLDRAAILPTPGDPFLLNYWLSLYKRTWSREINRLYIYLNTPLEVEGVSFIARKAGEIQNTVFLYEGIQIEHGTAIDWALEGITEKYVMLVEDDGFVFKPGIVDACFKKLEGGEFDIVGSKRGSCSTEILKQAQKLYNLSYEGEGDQGPNFWPCFFFTSRAKLLETDRQFGAKAWKAGEIISSLDNYIVSNDIVVGDTFVNTSLQLRQTTPENRIYYVPQYHGSPYDLDHFEGHRYLFDGRAPWVHIGSLSTGIGGVLRDDQNRPLARRLKDEPKGPTKLEAWCNSKGEVMEWSRRVQWWLTFWEFAEPVKNEMPELYNLYGEAIYTIIKQYGLDINNIKKRQRAYKTLGL
jgi:hypothetical protein